MKNIDPQLQHEQGPVDELTEAERLTECPCEHCLGQWTKPVVSALAGHEEGTDGPDPDDARDNARDLQYDRERMD